MKTILLSAKVILIAAGARGDLRHLQDAPLSSGGTSACQSITSVGNLGANYLTNSAPCLLTAPDASYSVDLTFKKTVSIAYDSFDLEGDSLTYSWTSDQSSACAGCFTDDGAVLTITSDQSIAGLTVNMEVIVSDADHATKYGFQVVVAKIPTEAPVSLEDDDSNDNPRFGITSIGNLGANYFTNAAPCLQTPPDETYNLDVTFDNTLVIPYDATDFESDSLTFSFTSNQEGCNDCIAISTDFDDTSLVISTVVPTVIHFFDSQTGDPILDENGNQLFQDSTEDISGQTITISMIVSDADHATTYTFTVEVEEEPDDFPPLSINDDEENCLEWEEIQEDPEDPVCVWVGTSKCEGIDKFEWLGDNYFINAAPCLLFPPDDQYELDFVQKNTVTISFDSYDFDDEEDGLDIEVYVDDEALKLCDSCFVQTDDDFTIKSDASIANMTFTCTISLADENHAIIYDFAVTIGEVQPSVKVSAAGMYFMSISEDDDSLCLSVSSVDVVEGGRFQNAAPCLLTPPDPTYELEQLKNAKISYDAFDMEENDLTFSWSLDKQILELCEYCFVDDGSSFTIYAFEPLVNKTFQVEIVVEDADHSTIYDFQVKILPPPIVKIDLLITKDQATAVTQDFSDLKGYEPVVGTSFSVNDWLSFYGVDISQGFDPENIEDLQKLPFAVPIPQSMDRFGQVNIAFTKPIALGSRRLYKGTGQSLAYKAFFNVELVGEDKDPQPVDFLVNVTETGMAVKINFTDPNLVSNDGSDSVRIQFANTRYLLITKDGDNRTPDGFQIIQKVPKQMVPSEAADTFESIVSCAVIVLQIIVLVYIVVSVSLKSILIWLWQTINALQLLVLLPLMCKFMPANALLFNESVRSMMALETIQVFFFGNTILKPDSTQQERLIFAGYKNVALVELLGGFNIIVIVALGGPILWLGFYAYQKLYIRFFKEANEQWLASQGMITKCIGYLLLYNPSLLSVQHFVFRAFIESYFNIALCLVIYCASNPFDEKQLPFIYYGLLLTVILILVTWFTIWNIFGPQRVYQYHRIDRMNYRNRQTLLMLYQSKTQDPQIEALRDHIKVVAKDSFEDQIYSKALVCCAPKLNGKDVKAQAYLNLNLLAQKETSFGQRNWRLIELKKCQNQTFEEFSVIKMSDTDTSSRKLGKPLTHGLRKYYHLSLIYYPLFMFRRLALICIALFVVEYSGLQIIYFVLTSLAWMAYICATQPFWDWNANAFEMFSELCLYIAGMHAMSFYLTNDNPEFQTMTGWSYTFFITLHVMISTVFLVGRILTSIVVAIRDRWQSSVAKKMKEQIQNNRKAAAIRRGKKEKPKFKVTQLEPDTRGDFISAKNLVDDALMVAKQLLGSNRGTIDPYYQDFLNESIKKEHDLELQVIQAKNEAQQETDFQMAVMRAEKSQNQIERERLQAEETRIQKELEVVLKYREQKDFEERLNRVQTTLDRTRGVFQPPVTAVEDDMQQQQQWKGNEILKQLQAQNRSTEHWDMEEQRFERKNSLIDQAVPQANLNHTYPVENLNTSVMDQNIEAGRSDLTHSGIQQRSPKSPYRSHNRKSMSPESTSPKVSQMEVKYNVESAVSQKAAIRAQKKQQFKEWYQKTNAQDQI